MCVCGGVWLGTYLPFFNVDCSIPSNMTFISMISMNP